MTSISSLPLPPSCSWCTLPFRCGGVLRLMLLANLVPRIHSYVAGRDPIGGNGGILSRFADVRCELLMTVGRTPNTSMPPEWAASGAKLGIPLQVEFSADALDPERTTGPEPLLGWPGGTTASGSVPPPEVRPLGEPSFVGPLGVEAVMVLPGAYSCRVQSEGTRQHYFRFFLDFPEGAVKNDVVLPSERIYFMTACWNDDEGIIDKARRWKDDLVELLELIDAEIDSERNPRGLMGMVSGLSQSFALSERRRKVAAQIDMLEDAFPPSDRLVEAPNNMVFLKEGVIAVKRLQGRREQYHWVGTFTFRKLVEKTVFQTNIRDP